MHKSSYKNPRRNWGFIQKEPPRMGSKQRILPHDNNSTCSKSRCLPSSGKYVACTMNNNSTMSGNFDVDLHGKRWIYVNCWNKNYSPHPPADRLQVLMQSGMNLDRLLQADQYNVFHKNIDTTADAYFIADLDPEGMECEIELARAVHQRGGKVVIAFSMDYRFLSGDNLINSKQTTYMELVEHADVIISSTSEDLKLFGRHQDKVMYYGCPVERLNLSTKPYTERSIDLLVSGKLGDHRRAFPMEICYMIKQKFPSVKIVYCAHPHHHNDVEWARKFIPYIDVVRERLALLLPDAKAYATFEVRPTAGRPCLEAFYFRVPAIFNGQAYHARLFPDFSYTTMSMPEIVDTYTRLRESNYHEVIRKAEILAEDDYFCNFYKRLEQRLWG